MPGGRSDNPGGGDDTPPTRSYVDALLRGNLSPDQLANLRAEIAARGQEEPEQAPRSPAPPAIDARLPLPHPGSTPPPSAPRSRPVPSSRPRGPSRPPSGPPRSWPAPTARSEPPPEEDDPRTVARSYVPLPITRAEPQAPIDLGEMSPAPDDDPRTVARSYVPISLGEMPPAPDDDPRTVARSYSPSRVRAALRPAPEARHDEDDQRTVARSYMPLGDGPWAPPEPSPLAPPPANDEPPISFEPPEDIAHPYIFDDDPPPEPEGDPDDEIDVDNLTAVHIYSNAEIGEMIDLGDLGDLSGHEGVGPSTTRGVGEAVAPSPGGAPVEVEEDLVEETHLAALGGVGAVPRVAMAPSQLATLPLGPQAGFVLSRVDGMSSVDDVLDMSGLPRAETLRILYDLLQQGVIEILG